MLPWRTCRPAGERPPRGRSGPWRWRRCRSRRRCLSLRRSSITLPPGHRGSRARTRRSSRPGSRPWTRSWDGVDCHARRASRSTATARADGPPWLSASLRRPRRQAASSPGWTWDTASTPWKRSAAASASNGSSSSPPPPSVRACPSRAACSRVARWTSSSLTCPAAAGPGRTRRLGWPTDAAA